MNCRTVKSLLNPLDRELLKQIYPTHQECEEHQIKGYRDSVIKVVRAGVSTNATQARITWLHSPSEDRKDQLLTKLLQLVTEGSMKNPPSEEVVRSLGKLTEANTAEAAHTITVYAIRALEVHLSIRI